MTVPADLIALAIEALTECAENADSWSIGSVGEPSEYAAKLREAIELIKRGPGIMARMEAVSPRTLGVDGPPTEWPVIVLWREPLQCQTVTGLFEQAGKRWWQLEHEADVAYDDDRYVSLAALMELGHE